MKYQVWTVNFAFYCQTIFASIRRNLIGSDVLTAKNSNLVFRNSHLAFRCWSFWLEIAVEWVMKSRPFWIKNLAYIPYILNDSNGRFGEEWTLLSVLCSLWLTVWGIYARENLQCFFFSFNISPTGYTAQIATFTHFCHQTYHCYHS